MIKKYYLIAIFTVTSIALQTSCAKKKNESSSNLNSSSETLLNHNYSSILRQNEEIEKNNFNHILNSYENIKNNAEKIKYLEDTYKNYKVKIVKILTKNSNTNVKKSGEQDNIQKEIWRLSATFYPIGTSFKEFSSLKEINSEIQNKVYHDLKNNFTRIVDFEKKYQVKINHLLGSDRYKFELTADWLDSTLRFEDLGSLEKTVLNGYHLIWEDKLTSAYRIIRGKSPKSVKSISPLKASKAFILDGFDDLATALESSQLSRKLVYSIQGLVFYPTFIFFVGSGVEGASDQHQELKSELKNLLLESYTQELEIKETIADYVRKDATIPPELVKLNIDNLNFKINVLKQIGKLVKNADSKILTEAAEFMKSQKALLDKKETDLKIQLKEIPDNIKTVLYKIRDISDLNKLNLNTNESLEFLGQLKEFKETQENTLKTYYETKFPGAMTEGGLTSMYYGMLAFESRAILNLIQSFSPNNLSLGFDKVNFVNLLGTLGDTFLAAGQAQMVLGGLVSIGYDIKEMHTISGWIDLINSSSAFGENSSPELKQTKKIMNDFYKRLRVLTGLKSIGNVSLTAGQFAMLLGGPFGFGNNPLTYSGAGATILGVVTKQAFEKMIESKYEFEDAAEGTEEHKIISGDYDLENTEPNKTDPLERIIYRIKRLTELSQKRAQVRVWHKLYSDLKYNTNIEKLIHKTRKNYLSGPGYHDFYLKALDSIFPIIDSTDSTQEPNFIKRQTQIYKDNIDFLNNAKNYLVQAKQSDTSSQNNSKLLFHRYMIQHLSLVKEQIEAKGPAPLAKMEIDIDTDLSQMTTKELSKEIKGIFNYADILGFSDDLERKILSKIIKGDGSILDKGILEKAKDYIQIEKVGSIDNPNKTTVFAGVNSIISFYKNYYLPDFLMQKMIEKPKFIANDATNEKIIYYFDRDKFLSDLDNFSNLNSDKKTILGDILKTIFTSPVDESKLKAKFGSDHRTPIKQIFDGIYKQIVRQDVLRPTLHTTLQQLELYQFTEKMMGGDKSSSNHVKFLKTTANRILTGINGINVGMNILYTPARIQSIALLSREGDHLRASRDSFEMIFDNADLVVDVIRGKHLMQTHPKIFRNLAGGQVVLNLVTAGFSIWQGVDNLIQASRSEGLRKQDHQVAGGIALASAGVSVATVAIMPFTSMAGPIGAAAGFVLMSAQSIYSTVRLHESLTELGVDSQTKGALGAFSLMTFGMQFDHSKVPGVAYASKVKVKENQLIESLKYFNENWEKNKLYFTKIISPGISYYYPYNLRKSTTYSCNMGGCSTSSSGGELLSDKIHHCQTNNIYPENKLRDINFSNQQKYITQNYNKLDNKKYKKMEMPYTPSCFFCGITNYYDDSRYCNAEPQTEKVFLGDALSKFSVMKTFSAKERIPSNVPANIYANLIYVGIDDQFKHGNSVSLIHGEENYKNFFIVNKGQFSYELNGANKDDYFEIRSLAKETDNNKIKISGNDGVDILSLQFLEKENNNRFLFVKHNNRQITKDKNNTNIYNYENKYENIISQFTNIDTQGLPQIENIEHFVGSNYNDFYIGTSEDDFIYGNNGNDKLFGSAGNDVLVGGPGLDYLVGGTGNDTYMITKSDFIENKESYDIINIFKSNTQEQPFYTNNKEEKDIIHTDLDNLGMYRENNDLWIVTKSVELIQKHKLENLGHLKIAKIENFFNVIKENNYNLPIITSKEGYIFVYNPDDIIENINWLNTVMVNPDIKIDHSDIKNINNQISATKGIRLDKLTSLSETLNAIGSAESEIIVGNNKDNVLNGLSGNDYLKGMKGNDILMANLDLSENNNLLELDGGEGEDIYIINLSNTKKSTTPAEIRITEIPEEKNSIVNINLSDYNNTNEISWTAISNLGTINILDKNKTKIFTLKFNNLALPKKINISTANKIYSIDHEILNMHVQNVKKESLEKQGEWFIRNSINDIFKIEDKSNETSKTLIN